MNLKLKTRILELGIRQIALARDLDVPEPVVSKIVNGWIEPKTKLKAKMAKVLGCRAEDIFPQKGGPEDD